MGGKIKYVSEKDKGIYNAFNKGIRMSTGKLIGIINSDDFYELDTVQKVVENMDESPYQVIYGYCNAMKGEWTQLVKDSHHNLRACMIPHETCFITRRTYCKYGLYVEYLKIASDYELMMRLYETKKVRFKQIPEVLINYAIGGISSRKDMFPVLEMENAFIHYRYHTISLRDFIELVLLNSFSRQYLKVKEMSDKHFALYTLMDKWYEAKGQESIRCSGKKRIWKHSDLWNGNSGHEAVWRAGWGRYCGQVRDRQKQGHTMRWLEDSVSRHGAERYRCGDCNCSLLS